MHTLLEAYLSEVARHLSPLPFKRRAEELREMRAHLENAVTVSRQQGRTEAEAARAAVQQFGPPEAVGAGAVAAWKRGRSLDRKSFWGSAACAAVTTLLVTRLTLHLLAFLPPLPARGFVQPPFDARLWAWCIAWLMPTFLLVGGLSGFLFPKRAVPGVAVGLTGFLSYFLLAGAVAGSRWPEVSFVSLLDESYWLSSVAAMDTIFILSALAAAWAGSRWRGRRAGRVARA